MDDSYCSRLAEEVAGALLQAVFAPIRVGDCILEPLRVAEGRGLNESKADSLTTATTMRCGLRRIEYSLVLAEETVFAKSGARSGNGRCIQDPDGRWRKQ